MTREEITQLVKQDLEEERDARIFRNLADVPDWPPPQRKSWWSGAPCKVTGRR